MRASAALAAACLCLPVLARAERFYAHEAVRDKHGVIAPWFSGPGGQCDLRVRIAAETLKRYPWTTATDAAAPAPHYVYNGTWQISGDGEITIPSLEDWANGDFGQRAAYIIRGLVDYYRYSGDPAAIAHLWVAVERLLEVGLAPPEHPWAGFLVSVPVRGRPYGQADPRGFIQLDITAECGLALVRAYELTGNRRWLAAAQRWAELLAEHCDLSAAECPWGRYANPDDVPWEDKMTGGVAFILTFFDALIDLGEEVDARRLVPARDAGRRYLRDVLLPRWTIDDTWGRNYWDWANPVQAENVTEFVVRYMMEHPDAFPEWQTDCRNIMSLFLNRTSVAPESKGGIYAGAWAYPESSSCCGRSLNYGPMELATVFAEYGVRADSEWAKEIARRSILLATYDAHDSGVVEDNIDGGQIVAGAWFKIAHPMALTHVLGTMAWLPEALGAQGEDHIMRSSRTVRHVEYSAGTVRYETSSGLPPCVDVLRLSFRPTRVVADGVSLRETAGLAANGYTVRPVPGTRGPSRDYVVTVRHDGLRRVAVTGTTRASTVGASGFTYSGDWRQVGSTRVASSAGASAELSFHGTRFRITGSVAPEGGLAHVYVDGVRQRAGIDCWCPERREGQTLFSVNGLPAGEHSVRVVPLGYGNPLAEGARVYLSGAEWGTVEGRRYDGEGGGPVGHQRVIFGYPARSGYTDSEGHTWLPATEWTLRSGSGADIVKEAWWTEPRRHVIEGTADPELYRYGAHGPDIQAHFTVGPGLYHVRLRLAETRGIAPGQPGMRVSVNGEVVIDDLDVAATAGGPNRAVDLVFDGIEPKEGVISVRLEGLGGGDAFVQAIEVGPGEGGRGATPVASPGPALQTGNLLRNGGFDEGVLGALGRMGERSRGYGWAYIFASSVQSYVWGESAYAKHPEWGLPEIHQGAEALRTHTDSAGHTIVYQEVPVTRGAAYRASVWVRAVDLRGAGFGASPGDSAGLIVQELLPCGRVMAEHAKVAVTGPCEYRELALEFTASSATTHVRFILDTVINCPYYEGHVTYDSCELRRIGTL